MTKEEKENYERLILTGPDMLEALHEALKVWQRCRRYFPKSIQNSEKKTITIKHTGPGGHGAEQLADVVRVLKGWDAETTRTDKEGERI